MDRSKLVRRETGRRTIKNSAPAVQTLNTDANLDVRVADLDWSDLRFLVSVGETGSLREAARQLNVSVNTVRTHLERLEARSGATMIHREARGSSLTPTGQRLFEAAASLAQSGLRGFRAEDEGLLRPDHLSIGCTEGVGTSWLTPKISQLRDRIAPVTIHLEFDYDLDRDRSALVDFGLTYRPPTTGDFVVSKVATIHFMLFASADYINKYGSPETTDDLLNHMFVEQAAPGYNTTYLDLLMGSDRPKETTAIRTNSALTQAYAAASGSGIAVLPSYTRALTTRLIPLAFPLNLRVPLSLFYHGRARKNPIVRDTVSWLRESFDSDRYPWFADRFVHPDDFPTAQPRDANVVSMFEHFIDFIATPVN